MPPQREKRGWSCWSWITRLTSMVVPRSHQHLGMCQRHTDIPKLSRYNFSCWLLQRNQLSFPQGSIGNQVDKNCFPVVSPSPAVHFPFCQSSPGKESACIPNTDGSHHQISAGALERPIWQFRKGSSILLKVLLLLIRTVKQAWHQDKEELTFLGY